MENFRQRNTLQIFSTDTLIDIKNNLVKSLLIGILITSFIYLGTQSAWADTISVGVYPPLTKIKTSPGSKIDQEMTISNYTDIPTTLIIVPKMFKSSGKENGQISFLPQTPTSTNFFSRSLTVLDGNIPVNQILLAPKEHRSLIMELTIPKNTPERDYYFCILFVTNNVSQVKSNASLVSEGIGTNVMVSVLKESQQDIGYIKLFQTPSFIDKGPVPIKLSVVNQGMHFTSVKGTLTINSLFLLSKDTMQIPPTTILGNSARYLTVLNNFPNTDIEWKPTFLFGIYKVDAAIQFGKNATVFHRSIYFYSYPLLSFAILLIALVFSGIVIYKILKNRS